MLAGYLNVCAAPTAKKKKKNSHEPYYLFRLEVEHWSLFD